MLAKSLPHNPHERGEANVAGVVLDAGDVRFRRTAFSGKLLLRHVVFLAHLLEHCPSLKNS